MMLSFFKWCKKVFFHFKRGLSLPKRDVTFVTNYKAVTMGENEIKEHLIVPELLLAVLHHNLVNLNKCIFAEM